MSIDTRLTLSYQPDPEDAATPDDQEPPPGADAPRNEAYDEADPLGVGEAIGGVRAAFLRMLSAHIDLLKAELSVAGKELGIIVGLAVGALVLAILIFILLYVGTFLFMGDSLFGSMGWGIIHGALLTGAIIGAIAVNLGGGRVGAYFWGLVWGLVVAVVLSLLFASNLLREAAVGGGVELEESVALHPNLLPTLVGFVAGASILAILAWIAGWRSGWRYGSPVVAVVRGVLLGGAVGASILAVIGLRSDRRYSGPAIAIVGGLVLGGFAGAILGSTVFDNAGAVAISITIGLLVWIIIGVALVSRRGFDTEGRYRLLVPRESMASFERTRAFVSEQVERQKGRFMGR